MIDFKEQDLIMIRLKANDFGFTNTWWRVMFIDNDKTFIGKLEKHHWCEFNAYKERDTEKFDCDQVQSVYKEGQQFCYSDKITICECEGLCRNK